MLIAAPRVLTVDGLVSDAAVAVEDGRVVEVRRGVQGDVVLGDGLVAPGFVDLQVNGYFGVDFARADVDEWMDVAGRLPATGVTSFLPTLITAPVDALARDLVRAEEVMDGRGGGARVLGVHVEGPFLARAQAGAHDAAVFCDPAAELVDALLAPGTMALLTLAPERAGALEAIARVAGAGVVASAGHSDAPADVVAAAVGAGLRMVTHLFNAQSGMDHREPGVAAQGLADPRLACGLILDGHHVAGPVARVAFAAAAGRIALVTDAIAAAGMPPGVYELGGAPVFVRPGEPPTRADGTLAGAVLRLDDAVARAVSLGVDPAVALEAASRVPADVLGRTDLGRLAPGCRADIVWLGPDLRTRAAWVGGELVYGAPA